MLVIENYFYLNTFDFPDIFLSSPASVSWPFQAVREIKSNSSAVFLQILTAGLWIMIM